MTPISVLSKPMRPYGPIKKLVYVQLECKEVICGMEGSQTGFLHLRVPNRIYQGRFTKLEKTVFLWLGVKAIMGI